MDIIAFSYQNLKDLSTFPILLHVVKLSGNRQSNSEKN